MSEKRNLGGTFENTLDIGNRRIITVSTSVPDEVLGNDGDLAMTKSSLWVKRNGSWFDIGTVSISDFPVIEYLDE